MDLCVRCFSLGFVLFQAGILELVLWLGAYRQNSEAVKGLQSAIHPHCSTSGLMNSCGLDDASSDCLGGQGSL